MCTLVNQNLPHRIKCLSGPCIEHGMLATESYVGQRQATSPKAYIHDLWRVRMAARHQRRASANDFVL